MNIALTTLVVIILLIPGILMRAALIKSEALENPLDTTFKTELIIILLFAIPLQTLGFLFVDCVSNFDMQQFYYFLAGSEKFEEVRISSSWFWFFLYNFCLTIIAILIGYICRIVILRNFYDLRFKVLPISNEWDNILSGRLNQHSRIQQNRKARRGSRIWGMLRSGDFQSSLKVVLLTYSNSLLQVEEDVASLQQNLINDPFYNRNEKEREAIEKRLSARLETQKMLQKKLDEIQGLSADSKELEETQQRLDELVQEITKEQRTIATIRRKLKQVVEVSEDSDEYKALNQEELAYRRKYTAIRDYVKKLDAIEQNPKKVEDEIFNELLAKFSEVIKYFKPYGLESRFNSYFVLIGYYMDRSLKERRRELKKILKFARDLENDQIARIFAEHIDFIEVEAIVEINSEIMLYRGKLQKYYLAKNNSLSKIVLNGAKRRRIVSPAGSSKAQKSKELNYQDFESSEFVIPFDQISNLNVLPRFIIRGK